MPDAVTIHLAGERPMSWNKSYAGMHWSDRKREADRVHQLVACFCPPDSMFDVPVHILVRVAFDKKPIDPDNIAVKYYIDGIKGRIISDDTLRQVQSVTVEGSVGPEPYVEIMVSPDRRW